MPGTEMNKQSQSARWHLKFRCPCIQYAICISIESVHEGVRQRARMSYNNTCVFEMSKQIYNGDVSPKETFRKLMSRREHINFFLIL